MAEVKEMISDSEVLSTFLVMSQLRTHLNEEKYLERIKGMREHGYRLAAVVENGEIRCVAGFRIQDYLFRGKHLYVDDLVTDENARSKGHGKLMLDWLADEARENGCERFHLDSGVQRQEAHRFYFREGMSISAFHFSKGL